MNRYHSHDAKGSPNFVTMPASSSSEAQLSSIDIKPSIDMKPVLDHNGKVSGPAEVKSYPPPVPLKCPFRCQATFTSKLDLQKHVRLGVHEKPPPAGTPTDVNCRHCGSKFNACNCHIELNKSVDPSKNIVKVNCNKVFMCRLCRKAFISLARIEAHYRSDHKNESVKEAGDGDVSKPVHLAGAESRFNPLQSKILQYKCKRCNAGYLTKRDLLRHFGETHGKLTNIYTHGRPSEVQALKEKVQGEIPKTEAHDVAAIKTSKCPFCPIEFTDTQLRMQHVLFGRHHFRCVDCNLDFVNLSSKHEHELTKHGSDKTVSKNEKDVMMTENVVIKRETIDIKTEIE